jgi:hypothetical protein
MSLDPNTALRNILQTLQVDPRQYRNFGIWWWPVKALLRAKFGREQLYLLGDYVDLDGVARVPELPLRETLTRAMEEFAVNARYNLGQAAVMDTEGRPYTIYDEDAGL